VCQHNHLLPNPLVIPTRFRHVQAWGVPQAWEPQPSHPISDSSLPTLTLQIDIRRREVRCYHYASTSFVRTSVGPTRRHSTIWPIFIYVPSRRSARLQVGRGGTMGFGVDSVYMVGS